MGRIVYIDSLKGLAILSVIVSHVSVFLLVGKINLLSTFVGVYMMPLFFVLSGLVITEIPNRKKLISKSLSFACTLNEPSNIHKLSMCIDNFLRL